MTFSHYQASTTPLFFNLKILKAQDLYKLNLAITYHKIHKNNYVGETNLTYVKEVHKYGTRLAMGSGFFSVHCPTNLGKTTLSRAGVEIWNKIPNEIKNKNIEAFKAHVKKMIFESYNT